LHAALARISVLPPATLIYCAHEYTRSGLCFAQAVESGNSRIAARAAQVARLADTQATVPFTLADELATNPFLRCAEPAVVATISQRIGHMPADTLETFTELRLWRDCF
jgi:hydroxyacylglutathione hydrolase